MTQLLPCLLRIDANTKKYRFLLLENNEVTIGRSPEVTHCLLSVMISRCHAILKKAEDGKWSIVDNKSLNGVFVNEHKLEAQVPRILQDGDIVQLGITLKPGQNAEFRYRFHSSMKIKRTRKDSQEEHHPEKKRLKLAETAVNLRDENCRPSTSDDDGICRTQEGSPYKSYRQKLETYQQQQSDVMAKFQTQLAEMQQKLAEKEMEQESMRDKLKEREDQMRTELAMKQEAMEEERKRMEEQMQEELESRLHQRETQLTAHLEDQRTSLLAEKQKVEQSLQMEMEKALEEKDKELEERLIKQKEQLEAVICEKELKQKMLESQLQLTQAEREQQKESTLRAREDILSDFTDLMETELQCSICNELFVWATSLNCSHAFCNLCIKQWIVRKRDCPVCRTKVTSQVRSIVLDSYIDKMVEHLSDELKERRKELVETRKADQMKWDEDHKSVGPGRPQGNPATPIFVNSEDEEDDEDNDDDDDGMRDTDSEEGDDAYYGGYGRCYSCGQRGHWANGCPNS